MIKIMLVIYAITTQGPVAQPIAEFKHKDLQVCKDVGALVVRELYATGKYEKITFDCKPFTTL